jgi:hypothetical protein
MPGRPAESTCCTRPLCFAGLAAAVVISAFADPREKCEDWAVRLMKKCKDDPSPSEH